MTVMRGGMNILLAIPKNIEKWQAAKATILAYRR